MVKKTRCDCCVSLGSLKTWRSVGSHARLYPVAYHEAAWSYPDWPPSLSFPQSPSVAVAVSRIFNNCFLGSACLANINIFWCCTNQTSHGTLRPESQNDKFCNDHVVLVDHIGKNLWPRWQDHCPHRELCPLRISISTCSNHVADQLVGVPQSRWAHLLSLNGPFIIFEDNHSTNLERETHTLIIDFVFLFYYSSWWTSHCDSRTTKLVGKYNSGTSTRQIYISFMYWGSPAQQRQ